MQNSLLLFNTENLHIEAYTHIQGLIYLDLLFIYVDLLIISSLYKFLRQGHI